MKPKRASTEVWRALEFVDAELGSACDAFRSDEERCKRDVIVVFVGQDPYARLTYEELVVEGPAVFPPTMAKDSVMVLATSFEKLLHIARRRYDVGDAEGEFPYEPGTAPAAPPAASPAPAAAPLPPAAPATATTPATHPAANGS
jgi:hypothetical protein